ncbi:MAG TPA: DNA recombination protein RmuC [Rhodospirillales bacterium]|nr:DNA recombination protein RmuC [Rhodospirillales bacterium]
MHDLFSLLATSGGAIWAVVAAVVALSALAALMLAALRAEGGREATAAQVARLADVAERLGEGQAVLTGRLQQTQIGLDQRLDALARHMGDGLLQQTERTHETLRGLHERLALIGEAQQTIALLSTQVTGLQAVLANKQARGAFGEVQLEALVASLLPADAYAFQATLSNRSRADCLLRLPDPPGVLAIDAKFPLESWRALNEAADEAAKARAGRAFAADLLQHVRDIAERYIVPGETADSALMFLPSEAVYAELHAHFRGVVEESFRRKVWIVSPTTLWATLNTVRAVLRDVRLKEQAGLIQAELRGIEADVAAIAERAQALVRHFEQASEDVRRLDLAARQLGRRAARLDLADPAPPEPAESQASAQPSATN